jgi:CRISPR-associated endonuclease/helicase Cas3
LPFHCLDVAAAGVALLRRHPALAQWVAGRLRMPQGEVEPWIAFWIALHDLGKFSEAFQSQCPDVFRALRQRPPDPAKPYTLSHDSLGMLVWTQVLRERVIGEAWFGAASLDLCDGLDHWARACTGHHGQPPTEGGYWGQHFDRHGDSVAIVAFVDEARALFLGDDVAQAIVVARRPDRAGRLAGLEHPFLPVL